MKGWESSEVFFWLLSLLSLERCLSVHSSPAQMPLGALLGLLKWIFQRRLKYAFVPAAPDPLFFLRVWRKGQLF